MTSSEDMARFHNGDTLDSIPIIRDEPERRPIPWRTVSGVAGTVLLVAMIVGVSIGMGQRVQPDVKNSGDVLAVTSVPETSAPSYAAPTATMTETVTATPSVLVPTESKPPVHQAPDVPGYGSMSIEEVLVIDTPATGGDPGTNYCLLYLEYGASLRANAPGYACHDFLFSTHPSLGEGVFSEDPSVECGDTPGGRLAMLVFDPYTSWGGQPLYTCLLLNDWT